MSYRSILAETVTLVGHNGDSGEAYYARPMTDSKVPGMVVIHHMPGWDEWIVEVARKFAHHGYAAIAPHLYFRNGPGSPDDIGARVRAAGGVADDQVVGDVAGAMAFLRHEPARLGPLRRRDRSRAQGPPGRGHVQTSAEAHARAAPRLQPMTA
jgi:carboxymethylenebutenolidase